MRIVLGVAVCGALAGRAHADLHRDGALTVGSGVRSGLISLGDGGGETTELGFHAFANVGYRVRPTTVVGLHLGIGYARGTATYEFDFDSEGLAVYQFNYTPIDVGVMAEQTIAGRGWIEASVGRFKGRHHDRRGTDWQPGGLYLGVSAGADIYRGVGVFVAAELEAEVGETEYLPVLAGIAFRPRVSRR